MVGNMLECFQEYFHPVGYFHVLVINVNNIVLLVECKYICDEFEFAFRVYNEYI